MDQDNAKKEKKVGTFPFIVTIISIVIALLLTSVEMGNFLSPYPGIDATAERLIREKLIKCYNAVDPKKYSEILQIMAQNKGKEAVYLENLKKKYPKYKQCDPNATDLLTNNNKPPSSSEVKSKKSKKTKKEKPAAAAVVEDDIMDNEDNDMLDTPEEPIARAEYVGCYGTENIFMNKVYGGGSNGAYYQLALAQASKLKKQYFAIARNEYDGHSFSFTDFKANRIDSLAEGEGCDRPCMDAQNQPCGCVDDLCDGPPLPGEEHNRRWAVYRIVA